MSDAQTHADDTGPRVQGSLRVGDQIGAYRVLEELGRGGMGVVLRVAHQATGAEAALKLLLGAAKGDLLERFAREAEVLAKVRHPDVIRVLGLGRAVQGPFLVTELVEGASLNQLVREGPLETARACQILIRLCGALSAVHAAGILHRDLKPQNVILRPDGTPVLLDFGIAQDESAEALTQTGQLLGTPSYMSPEQAAGDRHAVDVRSDVYGLGTILFTLLNGERPFAEAEGRGQFALIRAVLEGDPPWPRLKELPPELVALGRRALAKEPHERPQTPAALQAELEAYLAPSRGGGGLRRPLLGLVLAATALLAGVGAALGLRARGGAPASPSAAASSSPGGSLDRPPDLDAKLLALGSFGDKNFERRLRRLAREPAYGPHLESLRASHAAWARLEEASAQALSEEGARPELIADLRAYLRGHVARPESGALRQRLALLALRAPAARSLTLEQDAAAYGGASLSPTGELALALGCSAPAFGWSTTPEGSLEARPAPRAGQPWIEVDLTSGATRPLALPAGLPGFVSYARTEGGLWLGCQQPAVVETPQDPGASLRKVTLGDRSADAPLELFGLPAQSPADLARGTGLPRVLAAQGGRVAVGMGDGLVAVYDAQTRGRVWQQVEHTQRIVGLGFLADGRLLSASGRALSDEFGNQLAHPAVEAEDVRLILWSSAGERLRTYQRVLAGNGRPAEPSLVLVRGSRALVGCLRQHVVVDVDLERPDDSPGEVHRLLVGEAMDAPGDWRQSAGPGGLGTYWSPEGYGATGALWLGEQRVLVWGSSSKGWTVLRAFERDPQRGGYRQVLAWLRRDQVQDLWLSPDGAHVLISARLSHGRGSARHLLEWRRLAP